MSTSYCYDNLIAGSQQPIVSRPATIALLQDLSRGALLGRVLRALGTAEADVGNTGAGTIEDVAMGPKAKVGVYAITCIVAGAPGPAEFSVVDPLGDRLADAVEDEAYDTEILDFTIEGYGAEFVVGDLFTVEIEAGSLECIQADLDGLDGSAEPYAVLAEDVDASAASVLTSVYISGEFAEESVGYAAGEDVDDWRELCAAVKIFLRPTVGV